MQKRTVQRLFLPPGRFWSIITDYSTTNTWTSYFSPPTLHLSIQGGLLPAAHRRSCLHRGGLCGQRSTDWFLCPHWQELCHSKCDHLHAIKLINSGRKPCRKRCISFPVREDMKGGSVSLACGQTVTWQSRSDELNKAANCSQADLSKDIKLGPNVKWNTFNDIFWNCIAVEQSLPRHITSDTHCFTRLHNWKRRI